jgi:demethylmenaquinone methyltransferase / 2-methoxy-6-polyprenyl-1,4-benzoquinol methylase
MSAEPNLPPAQAPHQPLTDYYASEDERAGFVRRMFDSTAEDYDRMERILGFGTGPWYRGEALERAGLKAGMRIVDIGTGTGLVAREAVRITGDASLVVGVDPSPGMMAQAKLPGVQLVEGRAEAIPFPDASFDFLSMGYALRHISDLSVAFREFHRVMKPGARLCLLEITRPESAWGRFLLKIYMKGIVPLLAFVVGRQKQGTCKLWRYYWDTIEACVPPAQVVATLEAAGFTMVRRHIETKGLSILAEYQATKPLEAR